LSPQELGVDPPRDARRDYGGAAGPAEEDEEFGQEDPHGTPLHHNFYRA
jgi:hypothetical protein